MVVTVYMTTWCPDCARSRRVLQNEGVVFTEIDIDKAPGAEEIMRKENGGSGKVPTILIDRPSDGAESDSGEHRIILIEPSDAELTEALRSVA